MLSKRQFLLKYILMFNIYGNTFILLSIALLACAWYLFNVFSIIMAVLSVVSLYFGVRITMEYRKKCKYYFITSKKIARNGYSDDYFKWGFVDPCYRILSKYVLMENNRKADYRRLLNMFSTNDKVKTYIYNGMIEDALSIKWD